MLALVIFIFIVQFKFLTDPSLSKKNKSMILPVLVVKLQTHILKKTYLCSEKQNDLFEG